jgi:hypothetical protein
MEVVKTEGVFISTLLRDNKTIKRDRAQNIIDDTKLVYGRKVQDIEMQVSRLKRQMEGMLDLSPDNSLSLVPSAKNYDPLAFADEDLKLGVDLRNLEIKFEVAKKRYEYLFGEYKSIS